MFQFELTVCDQCGGTVKIVAAVTDPSSIRTYLEVGLPARAPPIAAARPIRSESSTWTAQPPLPEAYIP